MIRKKVRDFPPYRNNTEEVLEIAMDRRFEEAMVLIDLLHHAGFKKSKMALKYLSSSECDFSLDEKEKLSAKIRTIFGSDKESLEF